jgi:hypothetical protein
MTTPLDIARTLKWKDVLRAYEYHYPKYGHKLAKKAFDSILTKKKRKHSDPEEVIKVTFRNDWFGDRESDYYGCSTNKYSLSLRSWASLVNIPVSKETILHTSPAEFMAHFLGEITFFGDEGDMKKEGEKLRKIARSSKKMFKEL